MRRSVAPILVTIRTQGLDPGLGEVINWGFTIFPDSIIFIKFEIHKSIELRWGCKTVLLVAEREHSISLPVIKSPHK